jgi:hypothetical protein
VNTHVAIGELHIVQFQGQDLARAYPSRSIKPTNPRSR